MNRLKIKYAVAYGALRPASPAERATAVGTTTMLASAKHAAQTGSTLGPRFPAVRGASDVCTGISGPAKSTMMVMTTSNIAMLTNRTGWATGAVHITPRVAR